MTQRIIYPNSDGGIAVVIPAPDCTLPLEEIARKDVPAGLPYKFVDVGDFPEDRAFRGAWESDFSDPDGYGIGADEWFAENPPVAPTRQPHPHSNLIGRNEAE